MLSSRSPCSPLCGLVASSHCATAASAHSLLATCSGAWLHAPWPSTTPLPCKRHACPSNSASALALALRRYSSCSKSPPSATHAPPCFLLTPSGLSITSPGRPCSRRCAHGPSLSPCCLLPASFMARPAATSGQTMPEPIMRCSRLRAVLAFLDDTYIVCSPERVAPLYGALSATPCGLASETQPGQDPRLERCGRGAPPISPPSSPNRVAMFG